ncbi:hypothetical protein LB517_28145 [Mesorhizobium sp. BR1-1-12]|uniref:hypothetical protein n=1 Tax=Mesorhizobium sp. BR1-1-12 TaxID=2876657 RepID=UPI001CD0A5F4|nr:hypothetical protein [Mesorhizobium sp. BR1-1-12]MBZ9973505.1 hypothetical protein [Mesorhizobium sp. BR1-1-12]
MAATQLLATGSTAASSTDLTIAAGTPVVVCLKGVADGGALVIVSLKDDAGAYNVIWRLTSGSPVIEITGPGTYRFTRVAGSACGVFSA